MSQDASLKIKVEAGDVRNATAELSRLERQGSATERAANKLKGALAGVGAALSVREVIAYADAWTTVNNKLINTVKENEKLIDVTDRVFALSQQTRTSLDATATLYGRLAAATGDYVKEGATLEALVSNINKAMQVSGATAAESEGALVQLSQAFGAGALRGEEFNSVNEAAPRLMKALADSLGVARGQLKDMASEGKLTTEVLFKAWGGQSQLTAQINQEFANMSATAAQQMTVAKNNLVQYIGTNKIAAQVTSAYGDTLVGLSQNLDTVAQAGALAAGVYGGKMVGALAASAKASIDTTLATRQQVTAELASAKAAQASATSQVQLLTAQKAVWTERIKGATSEAMASRFRAQLYSTTAQLAAAETAASGAATRYAAAQTAAAGATRLLGGAMSFLGGPVGMAIAAATAISVFSSRSNDASGKAEELSARVRQLTADFKTLSVAEVDKAIVDVESEMKNLQYRVKLFEGLDESVKKGMSGLGDDLTAKLKENGAQMDALKAKRDSIINGETFKPEQIFFPVIKSGKTDESAAKKLATLRSQAEQYLQSLQRDAMTEQQIVSDDYAIKMAKLDEYLSKKAITQSEYDAAEMAAREAYVDQMSALDEKQADKAIKEAERVAKAKQQVDSQIIGNTQFMLQTTSDMIRDSGAENSGFMKALLAAQKALAIPSIMASTEMAASAAMAHETVLGGMMSGQMAANLIRAQGAISAGIVAGQAFAGLFDNGGNIPSGQWGIVGEYGPEIVKGPANVTSRKDTAAMARNAMSGGSGGAPVFYQTFNITGNGDQALINAMQDAARKGAQDGYNQVRQDFATNGSIRRIAGV
jgi:tape measure domain-containing protein